MFVPWMIILLLLTYYQHLDSCLCRPGPSDFSCHLSLNFPKSVVLCCVARSGVEWSGVMWCGVVWWGGVGCGAVVWGGVFGKT